MGNETKTIMTIRYLNGTEQKFEFTRVDEEQVKFIGSRIQDFLSANFFIFELEDRALIIPTNTIQNIEVKPAPVSFPPNVLRNVRLIS
jgi:hypothetical protein